MNEQSARVSGVSFSRPTLGLDRQSPLLLVLSECPWAGAARTAHGSCECRPAPKHTASTHRFGVSQNGVGFLPLKCLLKKMKGTSPLILKMANNKNGKKNGHRPTSGAFFITAPHWQEVILPCSPIPTGRWNPCFVLGEKTRHTQPRNQNKEPAGSW